MESAEKPSAAHPTMGDPNLNPDLRARAEAASDVVPVVLAAAARLPQPREDSMAQIYALGLYGSMIEQFSACVLLAQFGEPSTIPIILRSMYEVLVDVDNPGARRELSLPHRACQHQTDAQHHEERATARGVSEGLQGGP